MCAQADAPARVSAVVPGDPAWGRLMEYARRCPWSAGPYLARQMESRAFAGWQRVFAATHGPEIVGFCTLAAIDCVPEVSYTPFVGFVFVDEACRGRRISQHMINHVLKYASQVGFDRVYLTTDEHGLYEKYGFQKLADATDQWGRPQQIFAIQIAPKA